MPVLGRGVLLILAVPGIVAIALSIVALVVSILALLLLTLPVYRAIRWLTDDAVEQEASTVDGSVVVETVSEAGVEQTPARRQVEVRIID